MEALRFLLSIAVIVMIGFVSFGSAAPEAAPMASADPDAKRSVLQVLKKIVPSLCTG
ncbi:uncharacterized protein LOC143150712 [Ptiloglossa arizonensis]|uniref:uncharacterized protein LOC143150712 n=1 Tax=Ptiloglossa arizonensis TaxID=3350558 RepID=UPI003FA03183